MKNNKIKFSAFCLILFTTLIMSQCSKCTTQHKKFVINHSNIIIFRDFSTRDSPRDTGELKTIFMKHFYEGSVKPKIKINDESCIQYIELPDNEVKFKKDISTIKELKLKQYYILNDLSNDLTKSLTEIHYNFSIKNMTNSKKYGFDLISLMLFNLGHQESLKKDSKPIIAIDGDTLIKKYKNHIYVLSDGFLEFEKDNGPNEYRLNEERIDLIRTEAEKAKLKPYTFLTQHPEFCLKPTDEFIDYDIDFHLIGIETREKNNGHYIHKDGYRDYQIIAAVWKKWAEDSKMNFIKPTMYN